MTDLMDNAEEHLYSEVSDPTSAGLSDKGGTLF